MSRSRIAGKPYIDAGPERRYLFAQVALFFLSLCAGLLLLVLVALLAS